MAVYVETNGSKLVITGVPSANVFLEGVNPLTGETEDHYKGEAISEIDASGMTANRALGGNYKNNRISAGSGGSTMWGGTGGNDTLVGGSGRDVFLYGAGNGNDVFQAFTPGTSATSDIVNFYDSVIGSVTRSYEYIAIGINDNETVSIAAGHSADTEIQYLENNSESVSYMKVGRSSANNSFSYAPHINRYIGGSMTDTLSIYDACEIWATDEYKYGGIEYFNASNSGRYNILVGNTLANTLQAGSAGSAMWGGEGSAPDTLIGGGGQDYFWYFLGGGDDHFNNVTPENDVLYFVDGGINGITRTNRNINFAMSDGANVRAQVDNNINSAIYYMSGSENMIRAKIGNTDSVNAFYYSDDIDRYIGGNLSDTLIVNEGKEIWASDTEKYVNINVIDASYSDDYNILVGNSQVNTIIAGNGGSAMLGNSEGPSTLVGGEGEDWFWYFLGNGNDRFQNFDCSRDVAYFVDGGISYITRYDNGIYCHMSDGTKTYIESGSDVNTAVQYINGEGTGIKKVKVGYAIGRNSLNYENDVSVYIGGEFAQDTLFVNGSAEIWSIDEEKFKDLEVVDASGSYGYNIIVGNSSINKLIAGKGGSAMWGYGATSDTLVGGDGDDVFWYGNGDGNDVIENASDTDKIFFHNFGVADVTGISVHDEYTLIYVPNGLVRYSNSTNPTVTFSDGSNYKCDRTAGVLYSV